MIENFHSNWIWIKNPFLSLMKARKVIVTLLFSLIANCAISQNNDLKVTDIDGNVYNTVKIGDQIWMKENLRVTHFNNGDKIETTSPDTLDISDLKDPEFQWAYNGDENNAPVYGRLYTWYVVADNRNVCPVGWHVPSDEEFCQLENAVEPGSDPDCNLREHRGLNQGGYMKVADSTIWRSPYLACNNQSGFSVLPAGIRYYSGVFHCLGSHGYFWTATENDSENGKSRRFYYDANDVSRSAYFKRSSLSIRCVKD
jgi:uncharacterized protein (TIGR02145 family)